MGKESLLREGKRIPNRGKGRKLPMGKERIIPPGKKGRRTIPGEERRMKRIP
jgi:hypothetical protein